MQLAIPGIGDSGGRAARTTITGLQEDVRLIGKPHAKHRRNALCLDGCYAKSQLVSTVTLLAGGSVQQGEKHFLA